MLHILCLLVTVVPALVVTAVTEAAGSGGVNADNQRDKPYLILISIDGFRWDYLDRYDTPTLDLIAESGVRADALKPVFPTLTFPNHYSIATGLYPRDHKIVGNEFPGADRREAFSLRDRETVQDGSWYGGEPIWVLAEKAGMVTAAFFFAGSEADVSGIRPTHWKKFDWTVPGEQRVDQVLDWLGMPDRERPHMVTLYFEEVDHATHLHGVGSHESIASIEKVDSYIDKLVTGVRQLPIDDNVYLIVLSDHGQANYDRDATPLILDEIVDLEDIIAVDYGAACFLYLRRPDQERAREVRDAINNAWRHGTAWLPEETPASWKVDASAGFADVIVQANLNHAVYSTGEISQRTRSVADHGWAPGETDMAGFFLASGPRLPTGVRIPAIQAVDVYPFMVEILGLSSPGLAHSDENPLVEILQ